MIWWSRMAFLSLVAMGCRGDPVDTETETETDTDTGDEVPIGWFYTDQLSDIVPYTPRYHFLVTNIEDSALQVLDFTTGATVTEVLLAGSPERVVWNQERNEAAVVHGRESLTRLDLVDLGTWTYRSVQLSHDGTNYAGLDVCYDADGLVYVLVEPTSLGFYEVFVVDPTAAAVEDVWSIDKPTVHHRIAAADGDLYVSHRRYEAPAEAGGALVELREYDSTPNMPNKLALSADGQGILYTPGEAALNEYDRDTGSTLNQFVVEETGVFGSRDFAYLASDDEVVSLSLDFDVHMVEVYDRTTSLQLSVTPTLGPENIRNVFYDRELLVVSPDDRTAWVYAFHGSTSDKGVLMPVGLEE